MRTRTRVWVAATAAAVTLLTSACKEETAEGSASARGRAADSSTSKAQTRPKAKPAGKQSSRASVRPTRPPAKHPAGDRAAVTRHTDGDTLWVGDVKVRLIGVDTPEVRSGGECYGNAASERMAALLPIGTAVRLVYDVERRDRYGRTLAYVYRARDGLFVNAELVRAGYATVMTVPPNVAHAEDFRRLAASARAAGRGLWAECGHEGDAPAPVAQPLLPPAAKKRTGCDPSYPGVCIPPGPDLDCPDVELQDFAVVGADPHRFDADGDGIGCES